MFHAAEFGKASRLGAVLALSACLTLPVRPLRIWRRPAASRFGQVKFTLVALACMYFSGFAIHWHLITPIHRF